MNGLWMLPEHADALIAEARTHAPNETCGILAGDSDGRVRKIIPVPNRAENPLTTFYMDESALAAALPQLMHDGLQLLGFYHSHPNSDAIPSSSDIRSATYPDAAQVIIGFVDGQPRIAAWQITAGQVERVNLHIGFEPPVLFDPPQTRAQKTAILASALIAILTLIAVALTLLPPAPPIPNR